MRHALKPFVGTLWVSKPTRESPTSTRKRVLRGSGQPASRSVDSELQSPPLSLESRNAGAFAVPLAGALRPHRVGEGRAVRPGSKTRAQKHLGFPRNLGGPADLPTPHSRLWGPGDEPQARGRATWTNGSETTGAASGIAARRQPSSARGVQGVAHPRSTEAAGELDPEDPVMGKGGG